MSSVPLQRAPTGGHGLHSDVFETLYDTEGLSQRLVRRGGDWTGTSGGSLVKPM